MSSVPSTSAPVTRRLFSPPSDSGSDGGGTSPGRRERRAGKQAAQQSNYNNDDDDADVDVKMEGTENTTTGNGQIYIDSDEDSDPDDPIVKTLPVFLTPALADSLALIQYPHRPPAPHTVHPLLPPSLRPEDPEHDDRPAAYKISARYKPNVGQLELSVPLEMTEGMKEQRFNYTRAKNLGRGLSKGDLGPSGTGTNVPANASSTSQNNSMDSRGFMAGSDTPLKRMSLVGETIPDQTWYACAVLKDDEVHLTPLTRTMQMRASLHYLDEIDQLEKANVRKEKMLNRIDSDDENMSPGGGGASDYDESTKSANAVAARKAKRAAAADKKSKADDVKAINVSVAEGSASGGGAANSGGGGGPKDAKTARAAASLFGPAKAAQDEEWVDIPFFDPTTNEANRGYEKLFATKHEKLEMLTTATQYLKF